MSTPTPKTYVFKTIDGLDVPLDIYLPADESLVSLPILVWFHGGGLLQGSKGRVAPHMLRAVDKYGLVLVSADYRLAPQVGLPGILEDVRDAIKWTTMTLPTLLPTGKLDTARVCVSGSSAGGYIALLAGLPISGVTPKPKVLFPIYPITNPLGPFFVTPQRPVGWPTDGHLYTEEELAEHLDPKSKVVTDTHGRVDGVVDRSNRQNLYTYMVQEANLAHLLFVNAPGAKPEDYIIADHITKDFPPSYIVHGDIDHFVGVEQAQRVVEAFQKAGVEYEYDEPKGLEHGFDNEPSVDLEEAYKFIFKHL